MLNERRNARITSTMLGREDHGILTCWLMLDYGGGAQGFGGYAFDEWRGPRDGTGRRVGVAYGMQFIAEVLRVLQVDSWEKLPGTVCRAEIKDGVVARLGHYLNDEWFDPKSLAPAEDGR